jgi:hypothetical protein
MTPVKQWMLEYDLNHTCSTGEIYVTRRPRWACHNLIMQYATGSLQRNVFPGQILLLRS